MARDPNINYQNVLIKIDTRTVLQGSAHYRNDTTHIELKLQPPAPEGVRQEIEAASDAHTLYVNALPPSATNPDFQHKQVRFVKASNDRKTWEFQFASTS